MLTPTAGTKYQNEPIQAPLQKVEQSSSFNDLGREDARRIAEQNNPNTRYVDKPTATTSKRQLSDAMSRQQAVIRNAQRQVLGSNAVPQLKPSGTFAAPSVPYRMEPVIQGGSVRLVPRATLVTAVAGVQMMEQQQKGKTLGKGTFGISMGSNCGAGYMYPTNKDGMPVHPGWLNELWTVRLATRRMTQQCVVSVCLPVI